MLEIPRLHDTDLNFPPVETAMAAPNGLLALGGDLSIERLEKAYQQGIFPWYDSDQPIMWWSPDPRMVLLPPELRVSRSMRKVIRRKEFTVTMDRCFEEVISACADTRRYREGTWITDEVRLAYCELHRAGLAHSVEVYYRGVLAGGLYGIGVGQAFFGESMFSHRSNASKVAFIYLTKQLEAWGYGLIDCQVSSDHLASLGAREIPRSEFQKALAELRQRPGRTGPWQLELDHEEMIDAIRH